MRSGAGRVWAACAVARIAPAITSPWIAMLATVDILGEGLMRHVTCAG
jgi:hypothetical protein